MPVQTYVNNECVTPFRVDSSITYNSNSQIAVGAAAGVEIDQIFPTNAVTGITLQAGTYDMQKVYILNNTGGTITFAASGTSLVADGASDVIAAGTLALFVWSANLGLWFRQK